MSETDEQSKGLDALAMGVAVFQVVLAGMVLLVAISMVLLPSLFELFMEPEGDPDVIVLPLPPP